MTCFAGDQRQAAHKGAAYAKNVNLCTQPGELPMSVVTATMISD